MFCNFRNLIFVTPTTTIYYALSENCYFRPFVLLPLQSTKQTRPVVKQEITAPAYEGVLNLTTPYPPITSIILQGTGKSLSEALILASTNPQYDDRLFIELRVQYMKIASSQHVVYTT